MSALSPSVPARAEGSLDRAEVWLLVALAFALPLFEAPKNILWALYVEGPMIIKAGQTRHLLKGLRDGFRELPRLGNKRKYVPAWERVMWRNERDGQRRRAALAAGQGVHVIRAHEVATTVRVVRMIDAIRNL